MKRSQKNRTTGPVIKFWLQLPARKRTMKSRLRGVVDCNSNGCKLLDKDLCWICLQTLCFCWRRVRDWGNSNVSTCMSFALYSDNLHLPLAAPEQAGRFCIFSSLVLSPFRSMFFGVYMGWGWLGPWVGAITSWHLHTYLIIRHEKFNLILHYRFFFPLSHLVAVGLLGGGGLGKQRPGTCTPI